MAGKTGSKENSEDSSKKSKKDEIAHHKKSSQKMIIFGLVAAVLLVIAGSIFAINQINNEPNIALKEAVDKTFDADSLSFNANLEFTVPGDETFTGIAFSGVTSEEGNSELSFAIDLLDNLVTIDAVTTNDSEIYLKLTGLIGFENQINEGLANIGLDELFGEAEVEGIIEIFENRWIKIDQEITESLQGEADIADESIQEQIREGLLEDFFLIVDEELEPEEINGELSDKYSIAIDAPAFNRFVETVARLAPQLSADDLNQFTIDESTELDDTTSAIVWVERNTGFISQIEFIDSVDEGEVALNITMDEYNEPVQINIPEDAQSLEDVFAGIAVLFDEDENPLSLFLPTLFGLDESLQLN